MENRITMTRTPTSFVQEKKELRRVLEFNIAGNGTIDEFYGKGVRLWRHVFEYSDLGCINRMTDIKANGESKVETRRDTECLDRKSQNTHFSETVRVTGPEEWVLTYDSDGNVTRGES